MRSCCARFARVAASARVMHSGRGPNRDQRTAACSGCTRPSVGEGLQARPVLQLARAQRPDVQLAYTYFSPSAASFARGLDVDFADYLPFDTAGEARAALDALSPRRARVQQARRVATLARVAATRGVALGLVSATLAEGSSRRRGVAAATSVPTRTLGSTRRRDRRARRRAAGRSSAFGEIASASRATRATTRCGRACTPSIGRRRFVAALASDRPTLVAGSTWPADERRCSRRGRRVRAAVPDARLIIAPHEPTESRTSHRSSDGPPTAASRARPARRWRRT